MSAIVEDQTNVLHDLPLGGRTLELRRQKFTH
jgi:hypothetical protein